MTEQKATLKAELARFRQDPRVALLTVGGIGARAVRLVDLAAAEIDRLELRVTALELRLAGLGALRLGPMEKI